MKPLFTPFESKLVTLIGAFDIGLYCHDPHNVACWKWMTTVALTLLFFINPKVNHS